MGIDHSILLAFVQEHVEYYYICPLCCMYRDDHKNVSWSQYTVLAVVHLTHWMPHTLVWLTPGKAAGAVITWVRLT